MPVTTTASTRSSPHVTLAPAKPTRSRKRKQRNTADTESDGEDDGDDDDDGEDDDGNDCGEKRDDDIYNNEVDEDDEIDVVDAADAQSGDEVVVAQTESASAPLSASGVAADEHTGELSVGNDSGNSIDNNDAVAADVSVLAEAVVAPAEAAAAGGDATVAGVTSDPAVASVACRTAAEVETATLTLALRGEVNALRARMSAAVVAGEQRQLELDHYKAAYVRLRGLVTTPAKTPTAATAVTAAATTTTMTASPAVLCSPFDVALVKGKGDTAASAVATSLPSRSSASGDGASSAAAASTASDAIAERDELQQRFSALQSANSELQQRYDALQSKFVWMCAQEKNARAAMKEATDAAAAAARSEQALRAELVVASTTTASAAGNELSSLRERESRARHQADMNETVAEGLRTELAAVRGEVVDLHRQAATARDAHKREIEHLTVALAAAKAQHGTDGRFGDSRDNGELDGSDAESTQAVAASSSSQHALLESYRSQLRTAAHTAQQYRLTLAELKEARRGEADAVLLRERVAGLSATVARLQSLRDENERLREARDAAAADIAAWQQCGRKLIDSTAPLVDIGSGKNAADVDAKDALAATPAPDTANVPDDANAAAHGDAIGGFVVDAAVVVTTEAAFAALQRLLQRELTLQEEHMGVVARHRLQTMSLEKCESELDELRGKHVETMQALETMTSLRGRCERQLSYITKERDSFARLLRSYDDEALADIGRGKTQRENADSDGAAAAGDDADGDDGENAAAEDGAGDTQYSTALRSRIERVRQLEQSLVERDALIQSMQQKQQQQTTGSSCHISSSSNDDECALELVTSLRTENASLQRALTQARSDIAQLEAKVGRGDFDPSNTRVLHLADNPEKRAQRDRLRGLEEEARRLQTENDALSVRLAAVQSLTDGDVADADHGTAGSVSSDAAGGVASAANKGVTVLRERVALLEERATTTDGELRSLRGAVLEKEKLITRLKELFASQISAFRDACYRMTGFKIEWNKDQFRLRSMYAESESDFILFKDAGKDGGGMQVLDTDYCQQLDPNHMQYLAKHHSIPAFLAAVTLDLFEHTTRAI